MSIRDHQERKEKWEEKSRKYKLNSLREATFVLSVKNALELLKGKKEGRLLDIGCGFGEIDILFAKGTNFEITGCDISETALKVAESNIQKQGLIDQIKLERGDVYNLSYPDNSFDVVLSFGYVSAATYPGVQKEIARVLKPGGVLVCDFINYLSFYKMFNTIKGIIKKRKIPRHVSLRKIRQEFEKEGLVFVDQRFFNTYPPIDLKLSPHVFLAFENTLGRIFRPFLGRVRVASFQKIKL